MSFSTARQFREAVSDRDVVANAQFDDRWKYALGLSRSPDVTFVHSTLTWYRARLLETDFGRTLLQRTIADAGILGHQEDLVDFLMVAEAAGRRGTLALRHTALRRALVERDAADCPLDDWSMLKRSDYAERRKLPIDWASESARKELLQALARWARPHRVGSPTAGLDFDRPSGRRDHTFHLTIQILERFVFRKGIYRLTAFVNFVKRGYEPDL
jgi:hypothetical protein